LPQAMLFIEAKYCRPKALYFATYCPFYILSGWQSKKVRLILKDFKIFFYVNSLPILFLGGKKIIVDVYFGCVCAYNESIGST